MNSDYKAPMKRRFIAHLALILIILSCFALAAFALARPGYRLGDLILVDAAPLWPSVVCCSRL